jgi:hypothetical protein
MHCNVLNTHEDKVSNVVLSGVASALEAVDRQEVDAHLLGRDGVADRRALVDDKALGDGGLSGGLVGLDELDNGAGCGC